MNNCLCLIFSYNRACQLDAFLSSMKVYFKDYDKQNIIILYKYSDEKFQLGYMKLIKKFPNFNWIQETNIKEQVNSIIDNDKSEFMVMFCDDDIFKEPFDIESHDFNTFKYNKQIVCFSLRMNPNISKCHPMGNIDTPHPLFISENPYIWNWSELDVNKNGDWAYPMSVDGHLFRSDFIKNSIKSLPYYSNVGHLEAYLSMLAPKNIPFMLCSKKSPIFNIPLNSVSPLKNINMNITTDSLNEMYLHEKYIDYDKYAHFNNISPHQEVELFFK
jgi:hypothetical protein